MSDSPLDSSGLPPSAGRDDSQCVLRLYVSGNTRRSTLAIHTLKQICERYLTGRYALEIIDIYSNPRAAKEAQIIAVPTLVKVQPAPRRLLIGDLSDVAKLCRALDINLDPLP